MHSLHARMDEMDISDRAQDVAAKAATVTSAGGFGGAVLAANDWVQLFAGIVAIVAGVAAAWWHAEKIYDARKERRQQRDDDRTGSGGGGDRGGLTRNK